MRLIGFGRGFEKIALTCFEGIDPVSVCDFLIAIQTFFFLFIIHASLFQATKTLFFFARVPLLSVLVTRAA